MSGFQRAQTIYDAISGRRQQRRRIEGYGPSPDQHGGHGAVGSQAAAMALRRGPGREPDAANARSAGRLMLVTVKPTREMRRLLGALLNGPS